MNGFLAGSISGLTITLVAQPFEVIKTRIQENHQYSSVSYKKTLSIRDAFNGIVQKDGVGGLWRGTGTSNHLITSASKSIDSACSLPNDARCCHVYDGCCAIPVSHSSGLKSMA